jgi:hypothetical protein
MTRDYTNNRSLDCELLLSAWMTRPRPVESEGPTSVRAINGSYGKPRTECGANGRKVFHFERSRPERIDRRVVEKENMAIGGYKRPVIGTFPFVGAGAGRLGHPCRLGHRAARRPHRSAERCCHRLRGLRELSEPARAQISEQALRLHPFALPSGAASFKAVSQQIHW